MQIKRLQRASTEDALILSRIAHSAKAHWGYPKEWLDLWRNDLTLSPQKLNENATFIALDENEIIGFCMIADELEYFEIDHCWVNPEHMGKGAGRKLLTHALQQAEYLGKTFRVLSDPNAQGFYQKFGFELIKEIESKPKGRHLPLMEMVNSNH